MQKSSEDPKLPVRPPLLRRTAARALNACRRLGRLVRGDYEKALNDQKSAQRSIRNRLAKLEQRLDSYAPPSDLQSAEGAMSTRLAVLERRLDNHARQLQVRSFMDWIAHAPVPAETLVSVVLPTRDRRARLARAIQSVLAQTHTNWELLVVDDASVDDTPGFLAEIDDPRVKSYRGEGRGVCAARNVAMNHVKGDLVAYLDDDNIMYPEWLKSVVWAFSQRPDSNVIYGALVVDDPARINPHQSGEPPSLHFFPYDHRSVAISNVADMGCIAHRAGLAEAHFDETLREAGDWDLFLRLTRDAPPLALPAIACFYITDAPNRLSHGETYEADLNRVREKNRR